MSIKTSTFQYPWDDPFWEVLRFYTSLRGNEQKRFLQELGNAKTETGHWREMLGLSDGITGDLLLYCTQRDIRLKAKLDLLRTESESKDFCEEKRIEWKTTKTKNTDHHQSSKTLIAAVTSIASQVCKKTGHTFEPNPQRRCVWLIDKKLHVSARNLDGAVPGLKDPTIIWEIKEYWGKTAGGSKMSDAVYECQLVGRDIRQYERLTGFKINHVVFVDGRDQWLKRRSDLSRFIDLTNQGLIDQLFVGREVETLWSKYLEHHLMNGARKKP